MMNPPPARFHTKPTPGAATLGPKISTITKFMGRRVIPWQALAQSVACELDDKGRFRYHTVLISVPRQSGKTTSVMDVGLHRALTVPGGRVWYTAQTGQAARERWVKELATPAEMKLGSLVKIKRGAGDTRLVLPNGGEFRPMPPTADYLHGEQSDLVFIDEPWAHSEAAGAALLQAVVPTMATRTNKGHGTQTWFLSTKGTAASTWWHNMLDAAITEQPPGVCVIDYGIGPDVDPSDVEAVIAAHPGVGSLIDPKAVYDAAATLSPSEFARGYGNVATAHTVELFDAAVLDAADTSTPLDPGPVHLGVAVSWDRSTTAIVAVGSIDGVPAVEVIAARPGRSWVAPALRKITAENSVESIWIDPKGPAAALAEDLAAEGIAVQLAQVADLIQATENLLSLLSPPAPQVLIRQDPDLRAELAALALRPVGDLGRVISRKQSLAAIPRVEAAALALRGAIKPAPAPAPAPVIWSF